MAIPAYRKSVPIRGAKTPPLDARRRTLGQPYLPPVEASQPPKEGTEVALVYDNKGQFLGWMEEDVAKRWYYQLFYATANKYRVNKDDSNKWSTTNPEKYRVYIRDKSTNEIALLFIIKLITSKDIVDTDDMRAKAEATLKQVQEWHPHEMSRPLNQDPFGILGKVMGPAGTKANEEIAKITKQIETEENVWKARKAALEKTKLGPLNQYKHTLEEYLKSLIHGIDATKAGSAEAGVNLDV